MSHPKIDPLLVMPWSEHLSKEEPYEYPFKALYAHEGKKLIYIASLHANTSSSPTFRMIEDTFKNDKIDFVILEGFGSSLGISPKDRIEWASQQGAGGAYDGFETAFSIVQANAKRIPFTGGEPDESFVHSQILRAGYTTEDLLFYKFMQQVFQFQESHPSTKVDSLGLFEKFIKIKNAALRLEKPPTFIDFKIWYLSKMGQAFDPAKIRPEDVAPYENGKQFSQRVSSEVCKIRDQYILTVIDRALNEHSSLLVICGGSHWSTQKKALEGAIGSPSFKK